MKEHVEFPQPDDIQLSQRQYLSHFDRMLYQSPEERPADKRKIRSNAKIRRRIRQDLNRHIREAKLGLPDETYVTNDSRPLFMRRLDELDEDFDQAGEYLKKEDASLFSNVHNLIRENNDFAGRLAAMLDEARETLAANRSDEYVRTLFESLENSPIFYHMATDPFVKHSLLQLHELAQEIGIAPDEVQDAEEEEFTPLDEIGDDEPEEGDGRSPVRV